MMKGPILALQLMTRLPLPAIAVSDAEFAASIRWFPLAGLAVGAAVAGAGWAGLYLDPWAGALFALLAWVGMTGALHLDGLGDIADAAGAAHKDRARIDAVLANPHIGSFGVTAIALQLIAKLVLLKLALGIIPSWAIVAVPIISRIAPLVWTLWLPPLHEGLGAKFRSGLGWPHVTLWAAPALAAAYCAPGLLVALFAIPLWGLWLRTRIGGISGDGHGAGIELLESMILLALVVMA